MQKVAQTDTYVMRSLHLHSFFEQVADTDDSISEQSFVVSGTTSHSTKNEMLHNHYGSLSQLWQCAIEEKITLCWLDSVLKYPMLLNCKEGQYVHQPHELDSAAEVAGTPWLTEMTKRFKDTPILQSHIHTAYLCMRETIGKRKIPDHLFYSVWEMMTQIGYKMDGALRRPIQYFFFDTRQMNGNNNFESTLICPFGSIDSYYWNPYTDHTDHIHIMEDILLFCIGVKIQCKRNDNETFYLIRRRRSNLSNNPYVFVCLRSRVKYFCSHTPHTLKHALTISKAGSTHTRETHQMLVNAYFYYKLYAQIQNCKLNVWSPTPKGRPSESYVSICEQHLLQTATRQMRGRLTKQYVVHPTTVNISYACIEVGKYIMCLPVQLVHTDDMRYVRVDTLAEVCVPYAVARQSLSTLSRTHSDYLPRGLQLNSVLEVTHIILENHRYVPIQPVSVIDIRYDTLQLTYPSTYIQYITRRQPSPLSVSIPSFASQQHWEMFQSVCEALSARNESDPPSLRRLGMPLHTDHPRYHTIAGATVSPNTRFTRYPKICSKQDCRKDTADDAHLQQQYVCTANISECPLLSDEVRRLLYIPHTTGCERIS